MKFDEFMRLHASHLPLPPASGEETIFEFVMNESGKWEHWNDKVILIIILIIMYIV